MDDGKGKTRDYSPNKVSKLRRALAKADDFDAVMDAGLDAGDAAAPTRTHEPKPVDGLDEKDFADLEARKERSAEARYRAKSRGGRLVFK